MESNLISPSLSFSQGYQHRGVAGNVRDSLLMYEGDYDQCPALSIKEKGLILALTQPWKITDRCLSYRFMTMDFSSESLSTSIEWRQMRSAEQQTRF